MSEYIYSLVTVILMLSVVAHLAYQFGRRDGVRQAQKDLARFQRQRDQVGDG